MTARRAPTHSFPTSVIERNTGAVSLSGHGAAADPLQEGENPLAQQRRGLRVEFAEAAIGEQVSGAWIQKQLRMRNLVHEIAGHIELEPLVCFR